MHGAGAVYLAIAGALVVQGPAVTWMGSPSMHSRPKDPIPENPYGNWTARALPVAALKKRL